MLNVVNTVRKMNRKIPGTIGLLAIVFLSGCYTKLVALEPAYQQVPEYVVVEEVYSDGERVVTEYTPGDATRYFNSFYDPFYAPVYDYGYYPSGFSISVGFGIGWSSPYYGWGSPYYGGWYGWNDPWYGWGPGYGPGYGWGPGYG